MSSVRHPVLFLVMIITELMLINGLSAASIGNAMDSVQKTINDTRCCDGQCFQVNLVLWQPTSLQLILVCYSANYKKFMISSLRASKLGFSL